MDHAMTLRPNPNGEECIVPGCKEHSCSGPDYGAQYCVEHELAALKEMEERTEEIRANIRTNSSEEDMSFLD